MAIGKKCAKCKTKLFPSERERRKNLSAAGQFFGPPARGPVYTCRDCGKSFCQSCVVFPEDDPLVAHCPVCNKRGLDIE